MASPATTVPAEPAHVVIRPPGRWGVVRLAELWDARELLYFMVKREVLIRYKQSFFGVAWAILQPLAYAFIFALFFGRLVKVSSEGVPYPIFALAALVPWVFVSQSVSQSAASLVAEADVLTKVYFPRLIIPLARIGSFLADLCIALLVLGLFVFLYDASPTIGLVAVPGFILIALLTAFGMGTLLAALNVQYRDVTLVIPLITQLWLFISPIAYPASLVHGGWQYLYAVNPMVTVITGMRWALTGTPAPEVGVVGVSSAAALLLAAGGLLYFRRMERFFADVI